MKAPPERFQKPEAPPVLKWSKGNGKGRYVPQGSTLRIAIIDLAARDGAAASESPVLETRAELEAWAQWAADNRALDPSVFAELTHIARSIAEDLDGALGYVALAYDEERLVGATTYEVVQSEDREHRIPIPVGLLGPLGDRPVLYGAYSVAHPSSQLLPEDRAAVRVR